MDLSLRLVDDSSPLPHSSWLQFDEKSQTFYGVPLAEDVGPNKNMQYKLVRDRNT